MLTYVFEHNNVPLYEQVYQCMKHDIIEGGFTAGGEAAIQTDFCDPQWH